MYAADGAVRTLELLRAKSVSVVRDYGAMIECLSRGNRVQTVNLHHLHLCRVDRDFLVATQAADNLSVDGWPVRQFFPFRPLPRITGRQFVEALISGKADGPCEGGAFRRIALLGAEPAAAEALAQRLTQAGISLVVHQGGDRASWSVRDVASLFRSYEPDLILVAVTPPAGEILANQLHQLLPTIGIVGVGGGVDMAVGRKRAVPGFLERIGLEWAWRFVNEPHRLWRRYFLDCIPTYFALRFARLGVRRTSASPARKSPQAACHQDDSG